MKYKMIFIDLDGTLLKNFKNISLINKKIIKEVHDEGIEIVLTSGRMYNDVAYYAEELKVKSAIISSNGSVIVDKNNAVNIKTCIKKQDAMDIIDVLEKNHLKYNVHTVNEVFTNNNINNIITKIYFLKQNKYKDLRIKVNKISTKKEWDNVLEEKKVVKFIIYSLDKNTIRKARKEIDKISGVHYFLSGERSMEINNSAMTKGKAVELLCNKLGVKSEEIICIGDNENDISMIKHAGLGIAMKNAPDIVKKYADYITDSNGEDGVAKAIEKFVVNNEELLSNNTKYKQ